MSWSCVIFLKSDSAALSISNKVRRLFQHLSLQIKLIMSFQAVKQVLFTYLVSAFLSTTVHSRKCAHLDVVCLSPALSPAEVSCSKTSQQMTCPGVADTCVNISTEIKTETGFLRSYFYGCATETMCKDAEESLKEICQNATREDHTPKCSVNCCTTDFCVALDVTSDSAALSTLSQLLNIFCVVFILRYWSL
ncbi:uncharacterized protein LOC114975979 [Acropora millepora]|uniref:uncharacterized protein LOC114975979 n=1 Tax=Acropora millepora TaxID=45264 RepID=UPI001CF1AABA|nr:uncharacterized protein LOC114975979 [Acropora millepora]